MKELYRDDPAGLNSRSEEGEAFPLKLKRTPPAKTKNYFLRVYLISMDL